MDPYEKQFTLSDIDNAIIDLNKNLAQNWITRGVIQIADSDTGSGKKRLYSFHEAMQIDLVRIMTFSNDPAPFAGKVAKICADKVAEWMIEGKDLATHCNEEPHIVVFEIAGKDRQPECRFMKKSDFDINKQSLYFRTLDFHYCAFRLYDKLRYIVE